MIIEETQKIKEEARNQIIKKEKLEIKKDLKKKVDKIDHQFLEANQNLMVKVDQTNFQVMERKKILVLKENQVLQKKIIQNQVALQTIQNILEENP